MDNLFILMRSMACNSRSYKFLNESDEKKDLKDNNSNITSAPGHYEQKKDPFILYKFDDFEQAIQTQVKSNLLNRLEPLTFCI